MNITGMAAHQVQFYTEAGVIPPDDDSGEGRGRLRKWSKQRLFEFLILAELLRFKMKLPFVRETIEFLRSSGATLGCESIPKDSFLSICTSATGRFDAGFGSSAPGEAILRWEDMDGYDSVVVIKLNRLLGLLKEA